MSAAGREQSVLASRLIGAQEGKSASSIDPQAAASGADDCDAATSISITTSKDSTLPPSMIDNVALGLEARATNNYPTPDSSMVPESGSFAGEPTHSAASSDSDDEPRLLTLEEVPIEYKALFDLKISSIDRMGKNGRKYLTMSVNTNLPIGVGIFIGVSSFLNPARGPVKEEALQGLQILSVAHVALGRDRLIIIVKTNRAFPDCATIEFRSTAENIKSCLKRHTTIAELSDDAKTPKEKPEATKGNTDNTFQPGHFTSDCKEQAPASPPNEPHASTLATPFEKARDGNKANPVTMSQNSAASSSRMASLEDAQEEVKANLHTTTISSAPNGGSASVARSTTSENAVPPTTSLRAPEGVVHWTAEDVPLQYQFLLDAGNFSLGQILVATRYELSAPVTTSLPQYSEVAFRATLLGEAVESGQSTDEMLQDLQILSIAGLMRTRNSLMLRVNTNLPALDSAWIRWRVAPETANENVGDATYHRIPSANTSMDTVRDVQIVSVGTALQSATTEQGLHGLTVFVETNLSSHASAALIMIKGLRGDRANLVATHSLHQYHTIQDLQIISVKTILRGGDVLVVTTNHPQLPIGFLQPRLTRSDLVEPIASGMALAQTTLSAKRKECGRLIRALSMIAAVSSLFFLICLSHGGGIDMDDVYCLAEGMGWVVEAAKLTARDIVKLFGV